MLPWWWWYGSCWWLPGGERDVSAPSRPPRVSGVGAMLGAPEIAAAVLLTPYPLGSVRTGSHSRFIGLHWSLRLAVAWPGHPTRFVVGLALPKVDHLRDADGVLRISERADLEVSSRFWTSVQQRDGVEIGKCAGLAVTGTSPVAALATRPPVSLRDLVSLAAEFTLGCLSSGTATLRALRPNHIPRRAAVAYGWSRQS